MFLLRAFEMHLSVAAALAAVRQRSSKCFERINLCHLTAYVAVEIEVAW